MRQKHDYSKKFDMSILEGKIVMAFTDPLDVLADNYNEEEMGEDNYKYFTDNFTGEGVHGYYIFDTPEEFIKTWKAIYNKPNGMWYWVLDNGVCICSGACDPDDFHECFVPHWNL